MKVRDLHPRRFFLETWKELDEESASYGLSSEKKSGDSLRTIYIFAVVAVSLTLQEYLGGDKAFNTIVRFLDNPASATDHPLLFALIGWIRTDWQDGVYARLLHSGYMELWQLGYWACWRVFGFLVLPSIAVLFYPGLKFSEIGLSFKGFSRHVWVYGVLFLPVLAAVIIVSFTDEFADYYPFYSGAHLSVFNFVVWESFYIAQFFALEFFFRGFMIQPLRRTMGSSAIVAMMIPYVMIHYGKPMAECFAAVIAGVVLGTLAVRTRSIWAGFLIHVSVAISMDIAAIWQKYW